MTEHSRGRGGDDRDGDKPSIPAREAVQLAPEYITEITHRRPEQTTAVEATDEGGWMVEVQVLEDRRIPPSADMLALYEVELDCNGELLAYQRTRRYMRGQGLDGQETDLDTGTVQT